MNDAYIIYYHMDALQSMGLAHGYFSYHNYLVVQCWAHVAVLIPDLVTPQGPKVFFYFLVIHQVVDHMHDGTPCHYIMSVIDVEHPFLINAFPSPRIVNNCHLLIIYQV